MIVRNDWEYFHHDIFAITIVIRETMGGGGHTIARDTVSQCHVTEASIEALCHACHTGPHYVTECQIQTHYLQFIRTEGESKKPINHSNKIKRLLMLAGFIYYVLFAKQLQQKWLPCCYRIQNQGGSFKSSENVSIYFAQLPDLRVPHLFLLSGQCRVVSDQLSARESRDLAPIKLVSTLHFNLYPRSPPSLQRRPTLSGWD